MKLFISIMALCAASLVHARQEAPQNTNELEKIEAQIKASPDNPNPYFKKCRALFAAGRQQESIDFAKVAMEKFIQAKYNTPWLLLGSIATDKFKIDVHYNMSPRERASQRDGIVRPYSFRVWTLDKSPELIKTLDFEIAYLDGEAMTAAIGEMQHGGRHVNYGMLETDADFATVKAKALSILNAKETAVSAE
jgi:hypothetical protein